MFQELSKNLAAINEPKPSLTRFAGGLDKETPNWLVDPGLVRDALNYEIAVEQGYRDITGYERFDGQTAPSAASYTILDVTITGSIVVGDTVVGGTTGATGEVIATGTYPDDPSQTYLVLTKVTGAWSNAAENVDVSAVTEGTADAEGYSDSAPTSKLNAQYKNMAADIYRADIAEVPGEGSVWGGFTLGALKYAIRNKSGGATAGLYKESAAGWTEVVPGRELAFTSGGALEIEEGDLVEGTTSGASATVERVQVTAGSFSGGDAEGYLTLSGQSGTFVSENLYIGVTTNVATVAGDSSAITIAPSGRLDFDISNVADTQGSERIYGATGVDYGFEFDGTVFVRIHTGMVDDTPDHCKVHKRQLIFSFDGSLQHSGPGDPMTWEVVLGAAEIATGFRITGFQIEPGEEGNAALLVCCRQRMFILYGNDSSDWNLVRYREKVGAYEWTIQQVAYTVYLDDRGIMDLQTTQTFGNFNHSALSNLIRDLINQKRPLATASCVVRDKNQYRIFFSDKTAIYVTMDGAKVKGMMPITLNHQITTIWSQEDESGNEEVFFGCDDGFVYQMERGTSFDGDNIRAYLFTHFDHLRSIQTVKEFFAPVTVEGKGSGYAEFDLSYELDYGGSEVSQPNSQTAAMPSTQGSEWDGATMWDTFITYDDTSIVPTVGLDLRGEGRNISWGIIKDSDYFQPLLLSGIHFGYLTTVPVRG